MNSKLPLAAWFRPARDLIVGSHTVIPSPAPDAILMVSVPSPDDPSSPTLRPFSESDLLSAADSGHLSTADDPLYLISPGDIVEVSEPIPQPQPQPQSESQSKPPARYRTRYVSVDPSPESDPTDPSFHWEAKVAFLDGSLSPAGSFASAICLPPAQPGGSPIPLIHRDSPDSDWVPGPKLPPSPKPKPIDPTDVRTVLPF